MIAPNKCRFCVSALVAISLFSTAPYEAPAKELTEADSDVTPRREGDTGMDRSKPKTAEVLPPGDPLAGKFYVQSIIFTNPEGFFFKGSFNLKVQGAAGMPVTENIGNKNSTTEKQFQIALTDKGPDNADWFPMIVDGELRPDRRGGKGGKGNQEQPKWHWASTVHHETTSGATLVINDAVQADNLVLVADDGVTPRPCAKVTVVYDGPSTDDTTSHFKLVIDSSHDGIELSEDSFELSVGETKTVDLFSTSPSADWDSDAIKLYIVANSNAEPTGDPVATEQLTAVEPTGVIVKGLSKTKVETAGELRFAYPEGQDDSPTEHVLFNPELLPTPTNDELAHVHNHLGEQFLWSIAGITGLNDKFIKPTPDNGDKRAYGVYEVAAITKPYFRLSRMPDANDGFGEFDLSLDVYAKPSAESSFFSQAAKPKLFFGRINRKHPAPDTGDTANWYHYWAEEGKGGGGAVCQFSRDKANDTANGNYVAYWSNGTANGLWKPGVGKHGRIYISDKAAQKIDGWDYSFPETPNAANAGWLHIDISVDNAPDFVNLTYAHEITHRILHQSATNANDSDGDEIPDAWENLIPGMRTNTNDSFAGQFTVSSADPDRDNEFYCVIGGGMLKEFGSVKKSRNGAALPEGSYKGETPIDADEDLDWAIDGTNWKK